MTKHQPPSTPLCELLKLLELPHDNSLEGIVAITQKHWVQRGKERWQFDPYEEGKKATALPFLKALHCVDAIYPEKTNFDYALLLGGSCDDTQTRIAFLLDLWKSGVRFNHIVILTGQRALDPELESQFFYLATETQMMLHLWEKSVPADLRALPLTVVDSPQQKQNDGTWRRPNTQSTVLDWRKTQPPPGTCLAISSQPYIGRQDFILKANLPTAFAITTVGPAAEADVSLAIYLDNLATWLYYQLKGTL